MNKNRPDINPGKETQEFEQEVQSHLNRNILVQLLHGMFGQTGFRLFNAPTFMPAYIFMLSGSDFLVGLARSLQALGQVISPVWGASLIGHRPRMLSVGLVAGVLMRLQILAIALCGFLLGERDAVYAMLVFMTLMGFFQGVQGVMLNSLRAKVIPQNRRGSVSGWRNFLAGLTTAFVSYYAGSHFIDNNLLGDGYASLFLLAFVISSVGLLALSFTKEPRAVNVREKQSARESYAALPGLLRENPEFGLFFVARTLGSFGRMAIPFYILFVGTRIELSGSLLGVLTTVWMLTGTATNLVWGSIADRRGYRLVMALTLALWAVAHVQLLLLDGFLSVLSFFILVGTASGGFNQAGQNMVLEFGRLEDIPLRVAASNTAVNFVGTIGPLLGGLLVWLWSYQVIFLVCTLLQIIALIILIGWVEDPRHKARALGI